MKKLTLLVLLIVMLLAGAVSAGPDANSELAALAAYVPQDAPFFAAIQTSDAHLAALDAPLQNFFARLPPGTVPAGMSVYQLLNAALADISANQYTFDDHVRGWLGGSIALYLPATADLMGNAEFPFVFAFDVRNSGQAGAFFAEITASALEHGTMTLVELPGGVFYKAGFAFDPSILVTSNAVFIGTFGEDLDHAIVMPGADRVKLGLTEQFQDAVAALPQDDYSALVYLDMAEILRALGPMILQEMPSEAKRAIDLYALIDTIGQQAAGLSVANGRTLVLDIAHTAVIDNFTPSPLDMAFLERVPADSFAVIQGNGLAGNVRMALAMLDKADSMLAKAGVLPLQDAGPLNTLRLGHMGVFARLAFEGTTGLDFDTTLEWLDGDYALFAGLPIGDEKTPIGQLLGFEMEYGFIITTNNPDETTRFVEVVAETAQEMFGTTRFEDGLITVPLGDIFSMPDMANVSLGSNDSVMAGGSSASVAFALTPTDGGAITGTPGFVYESAFFLPQTGALAYVDLAPIRAAFEAFVTANPRALYRQDAEDMRLLLSFFDTASMTAVYSETGGNIRVTLTLGE